MKSLKLLLRFLTVGGLVLLLLIPLMMIRGAIHDRQAFRAQAVQRVSQSMAGPQQLHVGQAGQFFGRHLHQGPDQRGRRGGARLRRRHRRRATPPRGRSETA